jgi:hypothetical protein
MRLIINGIDIELTEKQNISRTLQVNDIVSLSNRQSNYTNTFTIKRTPKNERTFELLGIVGATSFLPYQKNECYLYTDDGECLIYKGWAVIQSTDTDYKINIYDGNIDLYKAIENKSLADLDLTELNHVKNLSNVVNSFTANLPYKYLVADYNGEMVYNTNRINIDYLVPSAKVSYLWNKIFSTYGFTYESSVFNTVDFTNLWLSYPKATANNEVPIPLFEGSSGLIFTTTNIFPVKFDQSIVIDNIQDVNKQEFIIETPGNYNIDLTGTANVSYRYGAFVTQSFNYVNIYKNGIIIGNNTIGSFDYIFNIGDVITVNYPPPRSNPFQTIYSGNLNLKIKKYNADVISFSNELKDFSIRDFITEILNRFGLTPLKDKYTNHYKFLTLQELLQNNQIIDWSRERNKFVEQLSEKYIFGSYAQQNKFTYKYNDTESDYYNSEILIDNVNLQDNKVVVNSKVYAPEKTPTLLVHNLTTNVYKMWNKEIKEDGSINYKGLQKRYYLMREDSHTFTSATQIGSKVLGTHQAITTVPVESFYNLRMEDVVRNYYATIGAVLNYSKIIEASIYLNEKDISDMDFSKLYWIKELNSYFLLNKVNNFTKKGITKVELIKVEYTPFAVGITPFIHFGFGQREKTIQQNKSIFIYQDKLFNSEDYDKPIINNGTVISSELNKIEVLFPSKGTFTINVSITTKDKTKSVQSNNLTLTVI